MCDSCARIIGQIPNVISVIESNRDLITEMMNTLHKAMGTKLINLIPAAAEADPKDQKELEERLEALQSVFFANYLAGFLAGDANVDKEILGQLLDVHQMGHDHGSSHACVRYYLRQ